ncbi:MAG TPA: hypothetical protein VKW06_08865 [Candidatus Angelobacter sp.]|nr:hypothetical protein [Candidatus Angelobacter sp.]
MRILLLCIVLACLALLTSCAYSHAEQGVTLDCSQAQPVGQNDDGRGILKVAWGPCTVNANGERSANLSTTLSYTLQHSISAKSLDAWIGTQWGSRIEVGYDLLITTPNGEQALFYNQFDKHVDLQGNHFRQWAVPLNLPAGTKIDIGLSLGIQNPSKDCPCGIHAAWYFNHGVE